MFFGKKWRVGIISVWQARERCTILKDVKSYKHEVLMRKQPLDTHGPRTHPQCTTEQHAGLTVYSTAGALSFAGAGLGRRRLRQAFREWFICCWTYSSITYPFPSLFHKARLFSLSLKAVHQNTQPTKSLGLERPLSQDCPKNCSSLVTELPKIL